MRARVLFMRKSVNRRAEWGQLWRVRGSMIAGIAVIAGIARDRKNQDSPRRRGDAEKSEDRNTAEGGCATRVLTLQPILRNPTARRLPRLRCRRPERGAGGCVSRGTRLRCFLAMVLSRWPDSNCFVVLFRY